MDGFSVFLQTIIAVGVVFYAIGQWRNGNHNKNAEDISEANSTISVIKARADAFQSELEEAKRLHRENHDEIIRLQEALKHKDQMLEQYLKIITNRNPDLEVTLKEVRNFLEILTLKMGDVMKMV